MLIWQVWTPRQAHQCGTTKDVETTPRGRVSTYSHSRHPSTPLRVTTLLAIPLPLYLLIAPVDEFADFAETEFVARHAQDYGRQPLP